MNRNIKIDLVVTRHLALVEYLREIGFNLEGVEVIKHTSSDMVRGKNVAGVLPHSLSCLTNFFIEVPLDLPVEFRGQELSIEDMRKYAKDPVMYIVKIEGSVMGLGL